MDRTDDASASFTCRRCGARATVDEGDTADVTLPWGETQEQFTRGANLTYQPIGPENRQQIQDAYSGPLCRYHPEPWAEHDTWGGDRDFYYDCCWSFDREMPGCKVGPHRR